MYISHDKHRLSIPRSFVWWGKAQCSFAVVATAALLAIATVSAGGYAGIASVGHLELIFRPAYFIALFANLGGLLTGSVLNSYLPSLFHPTPRNSFIATRVLLRRSPTARLVLIHSLTNVAALLSVSLFAWSLALLIFFVMTICSVGLLVAVLFRFSRFSRVAGRTPIYQGLSEHELVAVATRKRLDDGPEWESIESVTSTASAEAYRQLARSRFLTYRLLAAVVGAGAAAFIGTAVFWVLQQPPGLAAIVAFAPFIFVLIAQFLALVAEQYDSLSDRYAARGQSLSRVTDVPVRPTARSSLLRFKNKHASSRR